MPPRTLGHSLPTAATRTSRAHPNVQPGRRGVRGARKECRDPRKWGAAGSAEQRKEGRTSRGWERSGIPGSTPGVRSVGGEAGGER